MKKKRYTSPEQIVAILRKAEKAEESIGEVCRRHGVSEATFYCWRRVYGGMQVPDVKRLRDLEQENALGPSATLAATRKGAEPWISKIPPRKPHFARRLDSGSRTMSRCEARPAPARVRHTTLTKN